ncbi:Glycogen synthase [Aquisphaera giovannonii]|uniref:Glycogen synthase n=1 Tax=Aquisphaera giovannonii TaxID=406548 RepID=A0A5B9WD63_9BACT|nr:glycogen synthase GlgA [Aquisphaera giovannonii]QEH38214.1 Glycogen synthase [Aquisphaera giovannonii]
MNIVCVASEAVPFAKTGGLADVAAALPRALRKLGHDARLFLPCYRRVWSAGPEIAGTGLTLEVPVGSQVVRAFLHESHLPGSDVPVYLIDRPEYFDRDDLYQSGGKDFDDNCERFVFFDRAVLEAIRLLGLRPDVVHCNDWQTGLIPLYLKTLYRRHPELGGAGSLLTVHNLAYLGLFWHWDMPLTGLDWKYFNHRAMEFYGQISFMKTGLVFSDLLSTVSPTYAREIQTPALGCGLDGLLRDRSADLHGIVNGIEPHLWSPARESMLARNYDATTFREGKAACKAWLQQRAGLPMRPDVPLLAQIGRLDPQKGWDLLAEVADRLLDRDVQLVVLGTGHPKYHELLGQLAGRHEGKVWAYLGFSDDLAHQIEAGADLFLMPSLFEPCGLNQLYSLTHGTVPLVRATGGLADTVINLNPWTLGDGTANGFSFAEPNAGALWNAIEVALATWKNRTVWESLIRNGMKADWSWAHSAAEYVRLYQEIARRVQRPAA